MAHLYTDTYEDMTFEKEEAIAIVTFNRPEKLNALSEGIRKGLRQAISEVEQDDDIRVMIITGAGERGFCSGADVTSPRPQPTGTRTYRKGPISAPLIMLRNLDKPVIGAINGAAAGAGLGIALACDILIASENASFISAFIRVGLAVEWGVSYWLPKIVGKTRALEMMWTGERVDATEAERIGLVSRIVPAADLMKETKALAARLAKQPPMSVEFIKRLTYEGYDDTLLAHLGYEQYCAGLLSVTEDREEGVRAFREKRPAQFKGR